MEKNKLTKKKFEYEFKKIKLEKEWSEVRKYILLNLREQDKKFYKADFIKKQRIIDLWNLAIIKLKENSYILHI